MSTLPIEGIAAVIDLASRVPAGTKVDLPNGKTGILVPAGMALQEHGPRNRLLPDNIVEAIEVDEPDSMIRYADSFSTPRSYGFASLGKNSVTLVLDYHHSDDQSKDHKPDQTQHVVTLNAPFDADWKRWKTVNGQPMDQVDTAYFLESMLHTIAKPDGATLFEVVTDLRILRDVQFKAVSRLANGNNEIAYRENDQAQNSDGKSVVVPEEIVLSVPIFEGGEAREIRVKLRHRMQGGKITFTFDILRIETLERDAFRAIIAMLESETGLPFIMGRRSGK